MHRRCAFPLILAGAWLAGAVPGAALAAFAETAVLGIELDVDGSRERLRILADAPLAPELVPVDERTLMLALPGTVLGPTAPTRIQPLAQGTVLRVTAFEHAEAAARPEVRLVVQRRPGAAPRITQHGSEMTLEFEPRPRAGVAADAETISVAYRNAPIARVVTELARAAGEQLIFDESLAAQGALTIEGPARVTRGEALALLDSVLLLRGFAAVPAPGGGRKVVPIAGAPGPWTSAEAIPASDAPVTLLLRLETARATELLPVVQPYLGTQSTGLAFEPTNSLVLSGPASHLHRIRTAVRALDRIDAGRPVVWRLRHAVAETAAEQLLEILGERDLPLALGDPRTNALLLRVRPEALERARALVDRIDRPERGHGELQVIGLRFADPTDLASRLIGLRDAAAAAGDEEGAPSSGLLDLPFDVVADAPTRSLVVRADPATFGSLLYVIRELDRAPSLVRVEVAVATVDLEDRLDLGIDYLIPTLTDPKNPDDLIATVFSNSSGGGIPNAPGPNRPFVANFTRAPLLIPIVDPVTGVAGVLSVPREQFALTMNEREVHTRMMMRPELLITSGDEHELFAGDNIPVLTARPQGEGEEGDPLQVVQSVERYDVGTRVRVTPTVGAEGGVQLALAVEVSSVGESSAGPVEDVGPTIGKTEVESTIRLRHGEVAVLATSGQPIVSRSKTGVPWLQDIPGLGFFFRTTTDQAMRRYLLITAQAEILRPEALDLARAFAQEMGPPDPAAQADR